MVSQLALPEGGEWVVLLVIVVLLVGAKRLPDLTRNTARALVEFKKITRGEDENAPTDANTAPASAAPTAAAPVGTTPSATAPDPSAVGGTTTSGGSTTASAPADRSTPSSGSGNGTENVR